MKRIISVLICIALLFSLCGCELSKYKIRVDGVSVSDEVYSYYLSVAENSSEYETVNDKKGLARDLCAKYVASKMKFQEYDISLSAEKSVTVANETKVQWQLYSSFYEKYDVSKQTLCEILEVEAMIDTLVLSLYGENGERALQEAEIKSYFNKNFVAVKMISTDFTQTEDDKDVEDISQKYVQMRNVINGGGEFSSAAQQYPDLARYDDNDILISSYDTAYPQGFFEKIVKTDKQASQILRYSTGIYLVQKSDSSPFYEIYKDNCILKMKKAEVLNEIDALAKQCEVSYK